MNIHTFTQALAGALGAHPLLERLFFASVELAALALFLSVLVRLLRIRSPRLISFLLLIALIKPVITLTLGSAFPIVVLKQTENSSIEPVSRADATGRGERIPGKIAAVPEGAVTEATTASQSMANDPATIGAPNLAKWSWQEVIIGFWLGGAALFCASYGIARVQLFRIKCKALAPSGEAAARYHKEATALRLRRPPELLVSDLLESPALVGLFKPAVLLPAWLAATPDDPKFQWAVRHELTHWKWLDPLPIAFRDLARILFYFHPAVWWIGRKLIESIELACDRALIRNASEANAYAEQLFQILREIRERRRVPIAGGLFATRTQIGKRIAVLLDGSLLRVPQLTLLSLMCLTGVGLAIFAVGGAVGAANSDGRQGQDAILAEVKKLGGQVTFGDGPRSRDVISVRFQDDWYRYPFAKQINDELLTHIGTLVELQELNLKGAQISDDGLISLQGLINLKKLGLAQTKITGIGLNHLKSASNLVELDLREARFTDIGLANLRHFPNLEILHLGSNRKVTDEGLKHVAQLRRLRELTLGNISITDAGLAHLAELENLEKIVDFHRTRIGDEGLVHLKKLSKLKHLDLFLTRGITDASVQTLKGFRNLRFLGIARTRITDSALVNLISFPDLEELHLGGSHQATDAALEHLKPLPKLKRAALSDGNITEAGLASLKSLPPLEIVGGNLNWQFTLTGPTIGDSSLVHLKHLTKLESLFLRNTRVTEAGLAHLKAIPGLKILNLSGAALTDSAVVHFRDFVELEDLILNNTQISDKGLAHISQLSKLNGLYLKGTQVTDAGMPKLAELRELMFLDLSQTKITDAGIASLNGLPFLEGLFLNSTQATSEALRHMRDFPLLGMLELDQTQVTDEGLAYLKNVKGLYWGLFHLSLKNTQVTSAGIEALTKDLPNLYVRH